MSAGGVRHTSGHAPPARTKTIAVASHCPAELQPSPPSASWTIDDFHLLKKLYEGSLSVVCQAQHRRSGRHVALKIYKRSRLHEMERFQVRSKARLGRLRLRRGLGQGLGRAVLRLG